MIKGEAIMRKKYYYEFLGPLVLVLVVLVSMFMAQAVVLAQSSSHADYYFYIYGQHTCPHCKAMHRFLEENYGREHVVFCDLLLHRMCSENYGKLVSMGFPGVVPITFIVYNGTVSAVIVGKVEDRQFINELLHVNKDNTVPVYASKRYIGTLMLDNGHKEFIQRFLSYIPGQATITTTATTTTTKISTVTQPVTTATTTATTITNGGTVVINQTGNMFSVIPALIVLSLLDSINPCTIILYITFVLSFIAGGKTGIWPGIIFIAVVVAGYYLLGLGLYYVTTFVPTTIIIGLVALMSIYNIVSLATEKSEKKYKCEWCEKASILNRIASNPYILAVLLALFSVVVLLPCSSGPLLVFVSMIRNTPLTVSMVLLALYCIIFASPFMIILVTTVYLRKTHLSKWIIENSDLVKFVTSIAMLLIVLVLVLS